MRGCALEAAAARRYRPAMSVVLGPIPERVVLPRGFRAAGLHCGLKRNGQLDLGLLLADEPVAVAALFTKNQLTGAHVTVCRERLRRSGGRARAILVNARNANCATGARGIDDANRCCAELARRLGCADEHVLMASTGPIGALLPADRIVAHLDPLLAAARPDGGLDFARAIMTTDSYPKAVAAERHGVHVTGFAKGSGMIHPDMATMLGFLLADAVAPAPAAPLLHEVAERTFHRVTVDGDTSPNDSLFLLIAGTRPGSADALRGALTAAGEALARQLAADGEGASRLVTVQVRGARDEREANLIGRTIATSPLVKTAVAGRDPNWGRILSAAGRAGVPFAADAARVWVGSVDVFADGRPHAENEPAARHHLIEDEQVVLGIDLAVGTAAVDVWTCDLTADYVHINADYRT